MAKSPRAAQTRIAATVTARYYPSSGAADGFYLDGRITGRREHRAADITLDREDRGFFYSVFAHLAGSAPDDASQVRVRKALDKIHAEVHQPGRNIDNEINELAECAVSVTGRITLQHDGVRQPYFAGVMVRDSELAAVTMGGGCAYLYRGDVLYPLTADDFPIDAIDGNGKPVQGIDVYCAGVAGTVRYSNIAQLQLDDCIILCNREIMETLGQREILRMLYEAEDQADAAGLIITAASAKLPGVPMQFLIGFVESITPVDRTGRLGLSRNQTDAFCTGPVSHSPAHSANANAAPAVASPARSEERKPTVPVIDDDEEDFLVLPAGKPGRSGAENLKKAPAGHEPVDSVDEDLDDYDDEPDNAGRGRRIAFYAVIVIICVGCLYAIYQMLFSGGAEPTPTTVTTAPSISTTTTGVNSSETTSGGSETTAETTSAGTAAPTTTANNTGTQTYKVKAGDNLWKIAMAFYGSGDQKYIDLIKEANNMTSDSINVDQVLKIPPKP